MLLKLIVPAAAAGAAIITSGAFYLAQSDDKCTDSECFVEAARNCDSVSFRVQDPVGLGAEGRYSVIESVGNACRIEFAFADNPNPTFVDKPLTFLIDPEEASEEVILGALERCLTGSDGEYQCAGPLFHHVVSHAPARGELEDGEGLLPCGRPVEDAGEPLYAMPQGGKWGYVDRDGEWRIPPQWDRAHDFHEGRAVVGGQHNWGIIDRDGIYVVAQEHEGASTSTIGEQRWVSSPFEPYSEGCTVANVFTETSQPAFFIDRDGKAYWREERPEALQSRDIRAFGTFSEGYAWFEEGSMSDARYGWIDPTGSIVIEAEFSDAGDFSGSLVRSRSSARVCMALAYHGRDARSHPARALLSVTPPQRGDGLAAALHAASPDFRTALRTGLWKHASRRRAPMAM